MRQMNVKRQLPGKYMWIKKMHKEVDAASNDQPYQAELLLMKPIQPSGTKIHRRQFRNWKERKMRQNKDQINCLYQREG